MIPLSVPTIRGNEWKYVKSCLDTNWVSSAGEFVNRFEEEICQYTGAQHAISCINGTAALHTCLIIAGVERGDEVLVPTLSFIAPVNAVHYIGAEPVFMDCDEFYNIDAEKVLDFIEKETVFKSGRTYNKRTGRRISAIVPVHIFGNSVELEAITSVCEARKISIIEDATESLGSFYTDGGLKDRYTGTIGDMGCFSFNGNKIITTGGGGMIVTNNIEYAERARYLTTQAKDDPVRYIHDAVGYNYRMTNIQAAVGVAQLEQLGSYIETKRDNHAKYKSVIDNIPGMTLADPPPYAQSNFWFYCLQIEKEILGRDREELMNFLTEQGIQSRPVWFPNHLQKPYQHCQSFQISTADELIDKTLNIPCSVSLTEDELETVIRSLMAFASVDQLAT